MEAAMEVPMGYEWLEQLAISSGCSDLQRLLEVLNKAAQERESGINHLLDSGVVMEDDFLKLVAEKAQLLWKDTLDVPEDEDQIKESFPAPLAVSNQVFPIALEEGVLHLACYDPFDLSKQQKISRAVGIPIRWSVSSRRRVRDQIMALYGVGAGTFEGVLDAMQGDDSHSLDQATVIDEDDSDEASVLKFVNHILREALAQRATDIHVMPQGGKLRIRYRVDGHLREIPVPEHIHKLDSAVIARLKVLARLDVAERRIPQDGRMHLSNEGNPLDVRVATISTVEGETVSLRLLNQQKFDLELLELEPHVSARIEKLLQLTNGVILATGPTGSGKSTSLYCFLNRLNKPDIQIITIEDPVENKLTGVRQIPVRPEIGVTFSTGLRSILRLDPDTVMVGEVRDVETAEITIQASLTGHLVFSTLHTNSAIGGICRLIDMGIEPFLLSASLRGLLAQRLVRRLCQHCKRPSQEWSDEMKMSLNIPLELAGIPYESVGCEECRHTGYKGRVGLYEVCIVSPAIKKVISEGGDEAQIRDQAEREGFEDMRLYGLRKVMKGVTSLEEVLSSTQSHLIH